jgi:hypothetical protein
MGHHYYLMPSASLRMKEVKEKIVFILFSTELVLSEAQSRWSVILFSSATVHLPHCPVLI